MAEEGQAPRIDNPVNENFDTEDAAVDGGYGWVNVVCMLLLTAHTWGVNGAFGVYLAYYINSNRFPEADSLDYAFVGGLSISQITFIAPIVTKCNRKFGLTPTLLIGAVLEAGGLISASFATRVWHLYLAQGVLFGWGSGFQYIGASGVIPQWFTRRKGFANSIASAGSGVGGLIWCLATGAMIEKMGFRWSLRITAIVAFTVNIIAALLMKDRNKYIKPNQRAFDFKLFKNNEFVLLLVWGFFSMMGYTILLFSLPNFATEIGLSQNKASIVGALVNLGMAIGRPVVGFYSDSVGGINMATGATFFGSLVCFLVWMFADSYGVLILAAILGGTVCGTFWATIPPLAANAVGMKELPSGLSVIWTSVVVPCLFAEPIAVSLQDSSNISPKSIQIFAGSMFLGGAVSMMLLRGLKVKRLTLADKEGSGPSPGLAEMDGTAKTRPRGWFLNTIAWGKY